ncbi:hypothetical protein ACFQX6_15490 [Streptosporangium lutulentum]
MPREFAALVVSMSARLAADGVPVRLDGLSNGRREIDVRVLETCLAHGVPVAAPVPDASLDFSVWLSDRDADEDIPALAADPGFAPLVRRLVDRPGRDNLARVPALRPLLRTPSAGALMRHPLDDESLVNALYGLVGSVSANRTLSSIQVADAFLKGSLSQDQMEEAAPRSGPRFGGNRSSAGSAGWRFARRPPRPAPNAVNGCWPCWRSGPRPCSRTRTRRCASAWWRPSGASSATKAVRPSRRGGSTRSGVVSSTCAPVRRIRPSGPSSRWPASRAAGATPAGCAVSSPSSASAVRCPGIARPSTFSRNAPG